MTVEPIAPTGGKRHRWILWTALSIVALLIIGAGVGAAYLVSLARSFNDQVTTIDSAEIFPDESSRPAPSAAQNILLLGSDTRGRISNSSLGNLNGQRSDTIMVVHIPADRESVQVMSIMRDNWVPIEGHGEAKINAALSFGGMPLAVQTVESIIGARIDHVAIVDFESFKGLTDALGGVTVSNAQSFKSFPAGMITLNGEQALTFVRERMSFPDGDYSRARNQQAYMKGLIQGVFSADTLLDPAKVSGLVNAVAPYLTVDSGVDAAYAADLGMQLSGLRPDDISFFTSPTLGTGTSADGQSIVIPDWAELEVIKAAFLADTLDEYVPKPQFAG